MQNMKRLFNKTIQPADRLYSSNDLNRIVWIN